ncbi:hypothetical protein HZH66_011147 [Vespula vulgaris]|uniref:C2H2-type domain-containing protein n=1 Tax=Vespula vulgaris TaxID=7454 RepID=A0A834JES9_VESVU|nr:hypothetical protein HZH66_011147 [Vespula vulgaris]
MFKYEVKHEQETKTLSSFMNVKMKKYPCPKCLSTFVKRHDLDRHLKYECGQAPRFQCPYCSYRAKQRQNAYSHVRKVHKKSEVYTIDIIDNKIHNAEESRAKRKYAKGERFWCSQCSRVFCKKQDLTRHLVYECGQAPRFQCPYCKYLTKQRQGVYKHIRNVHKKTEVYTFDIITSQEQDGKESMDHGIYTSCCRKKFLCPKCPSTFGYKHDLNRHLSYECGQAPRFQCPHCRYRTKQRHNVYSHVRNKHKKRDVYAVDVIKIQNVQEESKVDMKCSSGGWKKEFRCPKCPKVHQAQNTNKCRTRANDERKKIQCPNCPSAFVYEHCLSRHLKYECGQAPRFQCPYCIYRSKRRCNVYSHVRKLHKTHDVYAIDIVNNCVFKP